MIDASAVARVLGISTRFQDMRSGSALYLPQQLAIFAQGNAAATYGTTKRRIFSAAEVGVIEGWGSPAHLIARELFPENGDGVGTLPVTLYPLAAGGGAAAAVGTVTISGTQTRKAQYRARIGGVRGDWCVFDVNASVAVRSAALMASINAVLHMPAIASGGVTNVTATTKWNGLSANDTLIEIEGDTTAGSTFVIVQPTGGLVNPSLATALAQVGGVWESMAVCALNYDDATALDQMQTFGEGRWGELAHKMMVCFWGSIDSHATTIALTGSRPTDRINSVLPAPASPSLPFVAAAAYLARIARLANNNPPHDYGSQPCPTVIPGVDSAQWDYTMRDAAVKAGCSTIEMKNGVANLSDVVTMYRPTGEVPPAYRHVVDIVKIQQATFNLEVKFATAEYDGAPFIPDRQVTTNASAKKPKMVVAAANNILDGLALAAIISDPTAAKKHTRCEIDSTNPKRWNLKLKYQLSGNSNVKDVEQTFGFYYGQAAVVG
jgi:phage tail sheath gpL-like